MLYSIAYAADMQCDINSRLELVRLKGLFSFETNKTHLRSTKTEERLTGLTTMSVHHAECLLLQMETVVRRFVQDKPNRFFCNSILFDESED